jgi:hypothetical protein
MPQQVTYYPDQHFVYVQIWGTISVTFLAARMAEWMYEFSVPTGYSCLTDTRGLEAGDRPAGFVLGRLFEQNAQDVLAEKIQVFRSERDSLGFIGVTANSVDEYLTSLPTGRTAT